MAAGFGSVRRFNETFQRLYHRPPSALRRGKAPDAAPGEGVLLMLAYRAPYDWDGMIAALAPLVSRRPGLRLVGDWHVDDPGALMSDRLDDEDERIAARAEAWRPWRAYGAAHLMAEGLSVAALPEQETKHDEAA